LSAGLLGITLVLVVAFVADINPWRLWADYQARRLPITSEGAVRHIPADQLSVAQPQPTGTASSISKTATALVLSATHPGRNAHEGYVDLGVNPASPQRYRVGALLANGAQIEEIGADYVVLERRQQRARLYLEGHRPADEVTANAALLLMGGEKRSAQHVPTSADPLTDYIRVNPIYRGDAVQAIEVYANEGSNVFAKLGLEPGDRITAINGEAVTDASAAIGSLRRLTAGEALQVSIERGGQTQTRVLDGLVVTAGD